MSVHLHIERLLCDGLPLHATQHGALRRELEARLAASLARFPAVGGCALPSLRAPAFVLTARSPAHDVAGSIAHSLHSALIGAAAPHALNVASPTTTKKGAIS